MSQVTIKEQGLGEIIDNIRKHLRPHWHVYLISLCLFISSAFVYLHYAHNVYEISAKISMIKLLMSYNNVSVLFFI